MYQEIVETTAVDHGNIDVVAEYRSRINRSISDYIDERISSAVKNEEGNEEIVVNSTNTERKKVKKTNGRHGLEEGNDPAYSTKTRYRGKRGRDSSTTFQNGDGDVAKCLNENDIEECKESIKHQIPSSAEKAVADEEEQQKVDVAAVECFNPRGKRFRIYTIAERIAYVEKFEKGDCKVASQFAELEGINTRVFQRWVAAKNSGKLRHVEKEEHRLRFRDRQFIEVENVVVKFVDLWKRSRSHINDKITWPFLRDVALKVAEKVLPVKDMQMFRASKQWLMHVLERNGIRGKPSSYEHIELLDESKDGNHGDDHHTFEKLCADYDIKLGEKRRALKTKNENNSEGMENIHDEDQRAVSEIMASVQAVSC